MRGIYAASYLENVARAFAKKRGVRTLDVGAAFDLVVGTSTGAIIVCALAAGLRLEKVIALFRTRGPKVFPHKLPATLPALVREALALRLFFRSRALRAGEAVLREALEETFDRLTLGQIYQQRGIALCLTAVEMSQQRSWVFKTPHLATSFSRDNDYAVVDACLASSAAPLFRSLARIKSPDTADQYRCFADGGLWANNPVLVALVEALQMLSKQPERQLEIFSLGTCPRPDGTFVEAGGTHWGLLKWRFGAQAAQLSLAAQDYAFDNVARLLAPHTGRECCVVRFPNGPVPASLLDYLDLDETSAAGLDALVTQAAADADVTMSACGRPAYPEGQAIKRLFEELPEMKEE